MKCSLIKAYNQQTSSTFGNQMQGQCKYQAHTFFKNKPKELKESNKQQSSASYSYSYS
jgi:hypothetical protein